MRGIGPTADEQFEYSGGGGRLSRVVTALGNGDLAAAASQSWTYDNLGLAISHGHPRVTGSFPVTTAYSAGLPGSITANAQSVVGGRPGTSRRGSRRGGPATPARP